jgi:hypothetical protein
VYFNAQQRYGSRQLAVLDVRLRIYMVVHSGMTATACRLGELLQGAARA